MKSKMRHKNNNNSRDNMYINSRCNKNKHGQSSLSTSVHRGGIPSTTTSTTNTTCYLMVLAATIVLHAVVANIGTANAFTITTPFSIPSLSRSSSSISIGHVRSSRPLFSTPIVIILRDDEDGDDDDIMNLDEDDQLDNDEEEEEEEEPDPYTERASSEFEDTIIGRESAITKRDNNTLTVRPRTNLDWGGALGKLRERVDDVESGKSQDPSQALFRIMSSETPNQLIGKFVATAKPQVVQAMSGAVTSLLGGLSSPAMGVETLVKASGERIGSLCFQLQMTGYMFRNAEYILALKDLLKLRGSDTTMEDYRAAFDRLDVDNSGYIESSEIKNMLDNVYDGNAPEYEIQAFLQFFDENNDGRISWDEFERGFAAAMDAQRQKDDFAVKYLESQRFDDEDEDEDEHIDVHADVKGTIQVELDNGKVVEVEASEYIEALKQEARELKEALRREKYGGAQNGANGGVLPGQAAPQGGRPGPSDLGGDIVGYIASRQGDMKSLTEGVSPEVVETMKKLVDFVLDGGQQRKTAGGQPQGPMSNEEKAKMEMEIPGSALQQLALWQLVLGYRLREAEAKREYLKLLE